jgi:folate-binding protein YgfZ
MMRSTRWPLLQAKKMKPEPTPETFFQYIQLRAGCGLVELTGWSSITLTGADRQAFLNNFCTNDIKRLASGDSSEAFFCNVKGRIIGHGVVTCRDNELVLVGPPRQGAALTSHLDRYIIREDVQVRDTTAERSYLLLAGAATARSIAISLAPSIDIDKPSVNAVARIAEKSVHWIHWELFAQSFAGLIEVLPTDVSNVKTALGERGAMICNEAAFNIMRIEAGTPLFGVDFDDHNFPQEVGRNSQAISFTKGCYLGQEIVARIDALGHVNQKIVGVANSSKDTPPVGTELTHGGSVVGRTTSTTFSPALGRQLALAMVRREHTAIGTELESSAGKWEVTGLPVSPQPAPN